MDANDYRGLAAVARAAKDPRITVSALRDAVEAGKLPHQTGVAGLTQVRLADVTALFAPEPKKAPAPIKLKKRRGQSSKG